MKREMKTIKTPVGGHVVILKSWLTGRERRLINNLFIDAATLTKGVVDAPRVTSEIVNKAQDLAFESVIISVDGNTKNVVNVVLDMRGEDFDFIVEEINKITGSTVEKDVKKK